MRSLVLSVCPLLLVTTAMGQGMNPPQSIGGRPKVVPKPLGSCEVINFEGNPMGTILASISSAGGVGPIGVHGTNPLLGANAAVVFDSTNPTGDDLDLGTPNEVFGGPGQGIAGESGPFVNDMPLGKVLIIGENLVDGDNDGLVDEPDDADLIGASFHVDFSAVAPVTVKCLTLLDIDTDRPGASVQLRDHNNTLLASFPIPVVGNNGVFVLDLGNTSGVHTMDVILNGSGAIDNIKFFSDPATIGDTVFCDVDDDGVQDPGEPGIPGVTVNLACAGPDGMLGTADDYTQSQVTDANGNYLFTDIPAPDICEVSVDPSTAPDDKILGRCPMPIATGIDPGEDFLDADFCFITPGEIGDTVYCDRDDDGEQDPGEPGIPGVLVMLQCAGPDDILGTGDDYIDSQFTDANGNYLFENVPPDQCVVSVDLTTVPPDKEVGMCPTEIPVDLHPGESVLDADFCFRDVPGEIGDTVWCDLDDDGILDPGEPGIPGVTVNLTCAGPDDLLGTADDITDSQMTDANGNYLFTEVPPGECLVEIDPATAPSDKVPGMCPLIVSVDLQAGESFLDADFCFINPPPGCIGDTVWCDTDDDGMQDAGEPGIPDVIVLLLCAGPDGTFGTADDYTDMDVTDAFGMYLFEGVPPGECVVTVDVTSVPDDKEVGMCPTEQDVTVLSGEAYLDADFCFRNRPGEIGDTVFCDLDDDGVQGPTEPGIPGVTVNLTCAGPDGMLGTADDDTDSQVTDANGNYLFTNVPDGECIVAVDPTTVDGKIPGICPTSVDVDLMPAESYLDADFCFVEPAELGDYVWCDLDDDGMLDPGEPGLPGVVIHLLCAGPDRVLGTADDIMLSTTTDMGGFYLFTDLPPGVCEVAVDVGSAPEGKIPGMCPLNYTVGLAPGDSFLDADFCFVNESDDICLVIIDEDTIDNGIISIIAAAASHGVQDDYLINDDRPTEVGNPPLIWNELFPGDIVLLPGGEVDDEGIFALPEDTPWSLADYVAGTVPQALLDEIEDVMPLRDQDLVRLIGLTCTAVVYDSDISMNYEPIQANLQGARYGLFTFTVLGVEVPHHIPEAGSSSSLYSLWFRVEPPMIPTINFEVTVRDHEPDSIQVTRAEMSGGHLCVRGVANHSPGALMTVSVDGDDAGSLLAVDPFVLEFPMTWTGSFYEALIPTTSDLSGRRLKISTDAGGADNIYIGE